MRSRLPFRFKHFRISRDPVPPVTLSFLDAQTALFTSQPDSRLDTTVWLFSPHMFVPNRVATGKVAKSRLTHTQNAVGQQRLKPGELTTTQIMQTHLKNIILQKKDLLFIQMIIVKMMKVIVFPLIR